MNFTIITHVEHIYKDGKWYGYSPYIREMNVWLKYVDELTIVAPLVNKDISPIVIDYKHDSIDFKVVPSFSLISLKNIIKTILLLPKLFYVVSKSMKRADHIHLRCPGNMGLIGCLVQVLFPSKVKTAKYAGNWDPKSEQSVTYRIQKWILNNSFLTRNMTVLVYGEWEGITSNIKPFFTATYSELDKKDTIVRNINNQVGFLFVGTLSTGKRPMYVVELVRALFEKGCKVSLELYGEGELRLQLEEYIVEHNLQEVIELMGDRSKEDVEKAYQKSHFLILPSKSEGWPKVVAEAMFWGCVPVATNVSCVKYMLGEGARGLVLTMELNQDINVLGELLEDQKKYEVMSGNGLEWSRRYTLDYFESEIKQLL